MSSGGGGGGGALRIKNCTRESGIVKVTDNAALLSVDNSDGIMCYTCLLLVVIQVSATHFLPTHFLSGTGAL